MVLELFEAHQQMEPAATAAMMGLQVNLTVLVNYGVALSISSFCLDLFIILV